MVVQQVQAAAVVAQLCKSVINFVMDHQEALIVFVRNPVLGKVKTRIAATAGEEKALAVYKILLQHTREITELLQVKKIVFYADEINENDVWNGYEKRKQYGQDLGERMKNAFELVLESGFEKIVIIGSDCFELTTAAIAEAFLKLNNHEIIIGPASDGGYYLLGMQSPLKDLFRHKIWSSNTVVTDTLKEISEKNLSCHLLQLLNDVDEEKDINFEY